MPAELGRPRGSQRLLTPTQVREARLSMEPHHKVAERFGVDPKLIGPARAGKTYGPLSSDEQATREAREKGPSLAPPPVREVLAVGRLFPVGAVGADQDRQEQLDATHECAHGRLPTDRTPPCGCWPQEITKTNPQEATNGSHRERLAQFAGQARTTGNQDDRHATNRPLPA